MGLENVVFTLILIAGIALFTRNARKIIRNINLGRDLNRSDRKAERWKLMARVALGQSKMVTRPIAGILHILVYAGFIIINLEVLEIILDGIFGTHRLFASFLGGFYDFLIGSFEVLALAVLVAVIVFLIRRNIIYIKRFRQNDLEGWPKTDANLILWTEILLMKLFACGLHDQPSDHSHTT